MANLNNFANIIRNNYLNKEVSQMANHQMANNPIGKCPAALFPMVLPSPLLVEPPMLWKKWFGARRTINVSFNSRPLRALEAIYCETNFWPFPALSHYRWAYLFHARLCCSLIFLDSCRILKLLLSFPWILLIFFTLYNPWISRTLGIPWILQIFFLNDSLDPVDSVRALAGVLGVLEHPQYFDIL